MKDSKNMALCVGHLYLVNKDHELVNHGPMVGHPASQNRPPDAHGETMAGKYPTYWRVLPEHWRAVDTYRIDALFPLSSSHLYHARKKLLVPGVRTGGKSLYDDIREAHATLGAWLADNAQEDRGEIVVKDRLSGCTICHGTRTVRVTPQINQPCPVCARDRGILNG